MEQTKSYIDKKGHKFWYLPSKGKSYYHRSDGPAVEYTDGSKEWCVDGKQHRLDGPAIEYTNGLRYWYVNGKQHRLDGPAVKYTDGSRYWYVNDKQHRLDGPAVECGDEKFWFIDGKKLPTKEVEEWIKINEIDLKIIEGQIAFKLRWM